ncbi:MAG: serine hydrolase, partial [Pseudomonadota bacterium]
MLFGRPILMTTALVLLAALIGGVSYLHRIALVGAGYIARDTCVEVFHAGRDADTIPEMDFANLDPRLGLIALKTDSEAETISAGFGPIGRTLAVHIPGYGCVVKRGKLPDLPALAPVTETAIPLGDPAALGFDAEALSAALDEEFADPLPEHRAMLILRKGQLVAERYAPGFDADTPMVSASMAKSVTEMMIGAAVQEGLVNIDDRAPVDAWSGSDDPRSAITWRHLLQMQSGLEFDERYLSPFADVPRMNVLEDSAAAFAIDKPLAHEPGTEWKYSTGTSNILQHILRVALEEQGVNYHTYARDKLFEPLGMANTINVPDRAGDFIGGSYTFATAREWAKLGQLHLQNGLWDGEQILPADWSEFVSTPALDSDQMYGGQVWLNNPGTDGREKFHPMLPDSTYMFFGYRGQIVAIVPEYEMVLVHLGRTPTDPSEEQVPINEAWEKIMAAFVERPS